MRTPKDHARPGDGGLIKPPAVVDPASGNAFLFSTSCKIDTLMREPMFRHIHAIRSRKAPECDIDRGYETTIRPA